MKEHPESGISECPATGRLGAIAEKVSEFQNPKAKNKRFQKHLSGLRDSIPADARPTMDFSLFIYGHTHKEEKDYYPFGSDRPWNPVIFNDGAWQRTATPDVWCTIAKSKGYTDVEALQQLTPEDLPGCYPFVSVSRDETSGSLQIRQLYWVQEGKDDKGSVQVSCSSSPTIRDDCL